MSDFKAKILAELDLSRIPKDLQKIEGQRITLRNFTIDTKSLTTQLQTVLNSQKVSLNLGNVKIDGLSNQAKSAGSNFGVQFGQSVIDGINRKINTGGVTAAVSKVEAQFNKLKTTVNNLVPSEKVSGLSAHIDEIGDSLKNLQMLQSQLNSGLLDDKALVNTYREYSDALLTVRNNMTTVTSTAKQLASQMDVTTLRGNMEVWLARNSKAAEQYGDKIRLLISELDSLVASGNATGSKVSAIANDFKKIDLAAGAAGLKVRVFSDSLQGTFQRIAKYVGLSAIIYKSFSTMREGVNDVITLNTALVDLQKTTDATGKQLRDFYYDANDTAKALGVTTEEIIKATAAASRLGLSIKDAKALAETSAIFEAISPEMNIDQATDGLVSAMKAFDIAAEDTLDGIASKINAVGNTQAVDNLDIVEVLTRSSSAMKEANNTLEQTIALGTAAIEITRDSAGVGQALKTVSMRIRALDEETGEVIGNIEVLDGDIANLTKTASKPGGISLFKDADKTEYKSTYEILKEISEIYDELSDKDQARLLEKLGGKRQGQIVSAILSNFKTVEDSLTTMSNSTGGAMREMEIIEQSLEYKLNALKETGVGVFQNLFSQETIGGGIDALTGLLSVIDSITGKLGLLGTVIAGIGIAAFVKNFNNFRVIGLQGANDINKFVASVAGMKKETILAALSVSKLTEAEKLQIAYKINATEEEMANLLVTEASTQENIRNATSAGLMQTAYSSLTATLRGLWTTMAANPIMALVTVASIAYTVITAINRSAEETRHNTIQAAESASNLSSEISESVSEFNELSEAVKTDESVKEQLVSTTNRLIEKLDIERSRIRELTGEYGNYRDAINAAAAEKLKENERDLRAGVDASTVDVVKSGKYNSISASASLFAGRSELENSYTALDALRRAGFNDVSFSELGDESGKYSREFSVDFNFDTSEVEGAIKAHDRLGKMLDVVAYEAGSNNFVYKELYKHYNETSDAVKQYTDLVGALNDNLAQQDMISSLIGKSVPKTKTEFDEYRQSLVEAAVASKRYVGTEEEVADVIDKILSKESSFADFYHEQDSVVADDIVDQISNSIADLNDARDRFNKALANEFTHSDVKNQLLGLSKGGNVDLTLRPTIDSSELKKAGWKDVGDGIATVFTNTFSNEAGNIAMNFTPIMTDENGKYIGSLSPSELTEYAEGVIAGARSDDLNLKIGATFTGENAIDEACKEAERIHELQEDFYLNWSSGDLTNASKELYSSMQKAYTDKIEDLWYSESFEDAKKSLVELAKTADGISPDKIIELSKESAELADILDQDGMSAGFLANILQTEALGGDGFSLITEDALKLNAALEGMTRRFSEITEAKSKYDKAMSAGEKDDDFKSMSEAFKKLNDEFVAGTTNSNAFWAAAEFLFGEEQLALWGWSDGIDSIYEAMGRTSGVFSDTESAGTGFLDMMNKIAEDGKILDSNGNLIASIEKLADGNWSFDVDALHIDDLAEQMGISKEAVLACLEALSMFGDVNYYQIEEVLDVIKEIGLSTDDFDGTVVNVAALEEQLRTLGYTGKDIRELEYTLSSVDGVTLIDVKSDVDTLTKSLVSLGIASENGADIKIKSDGLYKLIEDIGLSKDEAQLLIEKLHEADGVQLVNAKGDVENLDDSIGRLNDLKLSSVTKEVDLIATSADRAGTEVTKLQTKINSLTGKTVNILVNVKQNGKIPGFASGTSGAPGGAALVGEEGEELVKSGNRAYFVGTNGAEIVSLSPGDQVYTAEETKKIRRSSSVLHGTIPAYSAGTPGGVGGTISTKKYTSVLPGGSSSSSGKSSSKSSSSSSSKSESDESKVIDWIKVAIDRVEFALDKLATTANSTYRTIKARLGAAADEISVVTQELDIQQKAYDRYLRQADSVGLSSSLAERVRTGSIDISEYDETTQDLISDYQKWYEEALKCSQSIDKLHESLADLYKDSFDNIKDDFDNQIELLDHLSKTYDARIDLLKEKGYMESTEYYSALMGVQSKNIEILNNELSSLESAFSDAMSSGEIDEYSDAWYEFQFSINDVKESIDDATLSLVEYSNTMREIEWGYFDYTQGKISQITEEANFLLDLLENANLYGDNGRFNDNGNAALGLRGQNYNVLMSQADAYAKEILSIDKEIANDPYNTTLIERREELLQLQRDSILAAEQEKQAIVDLVSDGIDAELDALKNLIDSYNDALDKAKNLYDYQRKVSDQTSKISSLQKQLSAYSGDTSEESRSKIQKLQVDLASAQEDLRQTEYEQYISDQKKLLDELYSEYEAVLNERLDNVDLLISDMIDVVNAKSSEISQTLIDTADSVGYTLSQNMQSIWDGSIATLDGTISKYGDGFTDKFTSVQSVLEAIKANTSAMVDKSNKEAASTVSKTASTTKPATSTTSKPVQTAPQTQQTQQAASAVTVGGRINASGAKIYSYAGDTRGQNQFYAKDPIYTVLKEQNGYIQVRHHNLSKGVTGWFKKSDVKAYKTGGLVDYTGIAKVDGTPSKPELMLNPEDTQNLLRTIEYMREMSNNPLEILGGHSGTIPFLNGVKDISESISELCGAASSGGTTITYGDTNITIDHVDDYNDLVTKLRNDPKFEKMIRSMSTDRLAGKGRLEKYKHNWN